MKRSANLIILLLFFSPFLIAQGRRKIDSIQKLLPSIKSDTAYINSLNELAYAYNRISLDTSRNLALDALARSTKLNYKKGMAFANNSIGITYHVAAKYPEALTYYQKSFEIKKELGDKRGMASSLNNMGIIYYLKGSTDKALENYSKALALQKEINDITGCANTYNYMASLYSNRAEYAKSLSNYYEALKIFEKKGDEAGAAGVLSNIGVVYNAIGKYDDAIKNYKAALAIGEKTNDKFIMASSTMNLGNSYQNKGDLESAIEYFKRALVWAKELQNEQGIAYAYSNIGGAFERKKDYKQALEYYTKTLEMHKSSGDKHGLASAFFLIGNLYVTMGNYSEAEGSLKNSLEIAHTSSIRDTELDCLRMLAVLFKKKKDAATALDYIRKYSEMKDSVMNEKSNKSMTEMQTRFETEKKENEISLLQKENQLQSSKLEEQDAKMKKQIILLSSLTGILLLIILSAVFMYRSILNKKKANADLENKNKEMNVQKEIIEHKNEMITDSINYAKTLLEIRLANETQLKKYFSGLQMLDRSVEIVGGCGCFFYEKAKVKWLFLLDAQVTGVPGAFNVLQTLSVLESTIANNVKDEPENYFRSIESRLPSGLHISILKIGDTISTYSNHNGIKQNNGKFIVANDAAMRSINENEFANIKNNDQDLIALKFEIHAA